MGMERYDENTNSLELGGSTLYFGEDYGWFARGDINIADALIEIGSWGRQNQTECEILSQSLQATYLAPTVAEIDNYRDNSDIYGSRSGLEDVDEEDLAPFQRLAISQFFNEINDLIDGAEKTDDAIGSFFYGINYEKQSFSFDDVIEGYTVKISSIFCSDECLPEDEASGDGCLWDYVDYGNARTVDGVKKLQIKVLNNEGDEVYETETNGVVCWDAKGDLSDLKEIIKTVVFREGFSPDDE
jgi:hypothetical protein